MSEFDPYADMVNRMAALEADVRSNTKVTLETRDDVALLRTDMSGVLAAFTAAKGALQVLELIGKLSKPLAWIAAVLAAVSISWSSFKSSFPQLFK